MTRLFLFILIITLQLSQKLSAQNPSFSSGMSYYANTQVFRLKAWTTMSGKEWKDVIYKFPEFREGRITLAEGFSPSHSLMLNYNVYKEQVEFITERGDTSVLESSAQLKSVTIGDHLFYNDYPAGFVEKINQTTVALGAKHQLKVMFEGTNGERFSGTDWQLPTSRFDRLYVKKDELYFIDRQKKLHTATLPAILKIYPSSKKEVKKYVKLNKIDFKVKEDLVQLLDFCSTLTVF